MAEGTVAERVPAAVRSIPWSVLAVAAMAIALAALVVTYQPPADAAEEIGSLIRCPVCQGVPIADSPAPMARDMMEVLRGSLEDGASRREAIDAVLGAYPGSLLLEPEVNTSTIALWAIPLLALVAGGGLAVTLHRSRRGVGARSERTELEQRIQQVKSDLDELAVQEASGDIEAEAARHLKAGYRAELSEAETAWREVQPTQDAAPLPRSRNRAIVGAVLIIGALVVVTVAAGAFLVDRPLSTSGVAALQGDPSDYSNETLAAVIAANQDHPQIDGMRMALAERYFDAGDFQSAFPYYLDVASSEIAADTQAATALTRLGWMAYEGNGEIETGLQLLGQAQVLVPEDPFPLYLEGLIRWCGLGDAAAGAAAFREVVGHDLGDAAVATQVERDLAAAEAGQPCGQ